uniref:MIP18 family-like domain-containing protein n=1 Tax=Entomoneis paludosa TaxID=265537 RepID=A0A6U3BX58_9STRA|mmetsp:Transcript_31968/g.66721  ORF Transcript_31968/g.66721 Transcript_31968/m.66721 type:complete len:556 (+) Transcript_31968:31-1698(+)
MRRVDWLVAAFALLCMPELALAFLGPTTAFQSVHHLTTTTAFTATSSSEQDVAIPTEWQGEVLGQLKTVIDPDLGSDIVTLGFVQNLKLEPESRTISFDVELTTPACPVKDQFAADCQKLVEDLPWTGDVQVTMTAQESSSETETFGMKQIGAVIAVSSCKGGVGKSTTSVNLAFALQSIGASVGIFDADVYGPSLPTMVTPDDDIVRFVGRQIAPLQRNGVKLMSFGYVNDGSAVMRGPMVTQLLDQFLSVTQWGSLDYLIIDMPPGTGDIQLTLTQKLNITAAVIVTTPQELSFADVVRGVEMFDSVNVPSVAVVENMAYYEVDKQPKVDREGLKAAMAQQLTKAGVETNGGSKVDELSEDLVSVVLESLQANSESEKVQIFGSGHKQRLSEQYGIEHTFSVPLLDRIAANGDSGQPYILEHPDSPQAAIYKDLAKSVVKEVAKAKFSGQNSRPDVVFDKEAHKMVVNGKSVLTPAGLRRGCRCAACVEELTGRQILIPTMVSENIAPLRMTPTGNYALSVDWSDGHRSLYPYRQIQALVDEQEAKLSEKQEA